jgi:hypothetical protein
MILRSLFRNLSVFPPCYLYMSIPLLRPPVCSRSTPCIHFLRSIPSLSFPPHSPPCIWIFFSHPPVPPLNFLFLFAPLSPILPLKSSPKSIQFSLFYFIAPSTRLLVVFISLLYNYVLSVFSTIYCLYELFFPCILLLLFLVAFL